MMRSCAAGGGLKSVSAKIGLWGVGALARIADTLFVLLLPWADFARNVAYKVNGVWF
jgi:hypothetical protein